MDADEIIKTQGIDTPLPYKINFFKLIQSYKVIREYYRRQPNQVTAELENKYREWRDMKTHLPEKDIAEKVVIEEITHLFIYQDEIEKLIGFKLDV